MGPFLSSIFYLCTYCCTPSLQAEVSEVLWKGFLQLMVLGSLADRCWVLPTFSMSSLQPAAPQNSSWPICSSQWNANTQHWKLQVLTTHTQTKQRARQAKTRLRQPKVTGDWVSHAAQSQQKEFLFSFLWSRNHGVFSLSFFSCEFFSEGHHLGGRGKRKFPNSKSQRFRSIWRRGLCETVLLGGLGGDGLTDDAGLAWAQLFGISWSNQFTVEI